MSIVSILRKKHNEIFFTTPSHGKKFFITSKLRALYKWDISETDAYNPISALDFAQEKAAKIYGTRQTKFLTNGSTSGVIAAILACVKSGEKVLIEKNAHRSHLNAVKLAGGVPIFAEIPADSDWGITTSLSLEELEKIFNAEKPKALIITTPSYEGVAADVDGISKLCKKYEVIFIADEAHGALYPFSDKLPESAISHADFTVQSLHKTAGGLNPTALLHINCKIDVENALNMITTTSPSWPLLATIEKNINFLNSERGRKKLDELIKNIQSLNLNCEVFAGEPTKILIKKKGMTGFELSEFLYKNGIEDERTNAVSTMLLCGLGTELKDLKKLERVLKR